MSTDAILPTDRLRTWFHVVAIAEAFSWAGLLIGMYVKYIAGTSEVGVKIFGPIHGFLFMAYLAVVWVAGTRFGWSRGLTLIGLVAAIPPFCTLLFDRYVVSRRLLTEAPVDVAEPV